MGKAQDQTGWTRVVVSYIIRIAQGGLKESQNAVAIQLGLAQASVCPCLCENSGKDSRY
jgi:hypothetical protein